MRIAHIIAPYGCDPASTGAFVQRVTFETMLRARKAAAGVSVELWTAQFPEDNRVIPAGFQKTQDLARSILDLHHFSVQRKLPFLRDILDRLYQSSDAEHFIYTNMDISLQPHFYSAIRQKIQEGFDAFTINRRCISSSYESLDQLPEMLAEKGHGHPGYDCFVFPRHSYPRYVLGHVCVGMGHVDLPLVCSMIAYAKKFGLFRDEYLTFHLGDDRPWRHRRFGEYRRHNDAEAIAAIRALQKNMGISRSLGLAYDFHLRFGRPVNALCVRTWKRFRARAAGEERPS